MSIEELKVFLSIFLLSGDFRLPQKHMYWELSFDSRNAAASSVMRRNRFDIIMRFLHFQDEIDENDTYTIVRP